MLKMNTNVYALLSALAIIIASAYYTKTLYKNQCLQASLGNIWIIVFALICLNYFCSLTISLFIHDSNLYLNCQYPLLFIQGYIYALFVVAFSVLVAGGKIYKKALTTMMIFTIIYFSYLIHVSKSTANFTYILDYFALGCLVFSLICCLYLVYSKVLDVTYYLLALTLLILVLILDILFLNSSLFKCFTNSDAVFNLLFLIAISCIYQQLTLKNK